MVPHKANEPQQLNTKVTIGKTLACFIQMITQEHSAMFNNF